MGGGFNDFWGLRVRHEKLERLQNRIALEVIHAKEAQKKLYCMCIFCLTRLFVTTDTTRESGATYAAGTTLSMPQRISSEILLMLFARIFLQALDSFLLSALDTP